MHGKLQPLQSRSVWLCSRNQLPTRPDIISDMDWDLPINADNEIGEAKLQAHQDLSQGLNWKSQKHRLFSIEGLTMSRRASLTSKTSVP